MAARFNPRLSALALVALFFLSMCPLLLDAQPPNQLSEQLCRLALRHRECRCAYKAAGTRCCCVGEEIAVIPQELPERMTTLFLYNTSITRIGVDAFKKYLNLDKVHIDLSNHLKTINATAFERLRRLRKIFVSRCPQLTTISGTLLHRNHRLTSVIISNNSLESLPVLEMNEHHHLPLDLLDFSNLSDNAALHRIAPDAFAGVLSLRKLDLSGSRLTELPTVGLKQLEALRLKRVPSLKKLPSVLAFNNLNKAEFTYPYHCCFFKYATREYERGGDLEFHGHYKEIQQRACHRIETDDYLLRRRRDAELKRVEPPMVEKRLRRHQLQFADKMPNITEEEHQPYSGDELGRSMVLQKCVDTAGNSGQMGVLNQLNESVSNFYMNITCTPEPNELNPCEDIVSYPTLRFFLWPMWMIAIVGNISVWVIIAAVWKRRLRYHYFFMLNLSVADFATGVYLAFLAFADWKTRNEYYNYAVEWQTGWGCSVVGFINIFASELSIKSTTTPDFAFYGRRFNSWAAYGAVAFGYLYAITMAALPLFGVSSYEVSSICLPLSIENASDRIYLIVGLTMTGLAFAGMILSYVLINCMLQGRNTPARTEDKQIFLRTLVLIGTDIVCWMPTLFFGLTAAAGHPLITLTNAKICLILFYPINSCCNPVLYVFLTRIWKDARKKAPFLERMAKSKSDKQQSQLNAFFYQQSPGNRDGRAQSSPDDEEVNRLLQVTQTTSLNSTPRGSSSSASPMVRLSNGDLVSSSLLLGFDQRRPSRASFQEGGDSLTGGEKKRKSIPSLPMFRLRISAIPEMSDISESNSSNSAEDYERRHKPRTQSKLAVSPTVRHSRRTQSGSSLPPARSSLQFADNDSGKGDSLRSTKGVLLHDQPNGTSTPRIYFTTHSDDEAERTTE
ncbi:Follicle-stimulating hormone receptor [Aphelenchoides fujianensis]|nr:Follicle-stimulating hormone receptor [Aphelenchoides fujianensis]